VISTIDSSNAKFRPLYAWENPIKTKIEIICQQIYGADGVDYTAKAETDIKRAETLGLAGLPICMAKTQKSLSDDPEKIGRPVGFRVTVREMEIAAGAGFLVPITGQMMRMPGLPATPAAESIDIDEHGQISGLF
jgi:formate--tetrahydrofolate ligase